MTTEADDWIVPADDWIIPDAPASPGRSSVSGLVRPEIRSALPSLPPVTANPDAADPQRPLDMLQRDRDAPLAPRPVPTDSVGVAARLAPDFALDLLQQGARPSAPPSPSRAAAVAADLPLPPPAPDPLQQLAEEDFSVPQPRMPDLRGTRIARGVEALGYVPTPADVLRDEVAQPPDMGDPASFGGQRMTYAEATTGQRAADQLRSGVETARQYASGLNFAALMRQLQEADAADAGAPPPRDRLGRPADAIPWADLTPEQRARTRQRIEQELGTQIRAYIRSQGRQRELLANPAVAEMTQAADEGRWGDVWRILRSDPAGIVQQLSVESLPQMVPGMVGAGVGAVVAGRVGMMVGQFGGSFAADAGARLVEILGRRMQEAGVNTEDGPSVDAWLRANGPVVQESMAAAQRGAYGPATADAASLGLAAPFRRGAGAVRNLGIAGRNLGVEIGTEGAGEVAAGVLSGEGVRPGDVLSEMLGAGPQAAGSTALATAGAIRDGTF
ncbi:MAG: hypothetical protein K2X74_20145, partial [Acetobacteraceae bacterium]|nr:hypothetical protein [Acetobacteraceae bacterium]